MKMGIRDDLRQRLIDAHNSGSCLTPTSPSDAHRLKNACRRGDLVSPVRQLYALPELWNELKPHVRELHKVRALASLHPDWVFCGPTAAVVHNMSVSYRLLGTTHVALPRGKLRKVRGVRFHALTHVEASEADGILVTSVPRTAFDCLRAHDFRPSLAIADSALRVTGLSRDKMIELLKEFNTRSNGAQRAVEIMQLADGKSESGGESIARAVMIECGVMIPTLQQELADPTDPTKLFRVDFFWQLPTGNVAGELDGREKYVDTSMTDGLSAVDVMRKERLRESRLTGAGVKVVRFSYGDVMDVNTFLHLLTSYGIPSGFAIPSVARESRMS